MNNTNKPATCKAHLWAYYSDLTIKCSVCGKPAFRLDTADWYSLQKNTAAAYRKAKETEPMIKTASPPILTWAGQGRTDEDGPSQGTLFWSGLLLMGLACAAGVYLILKGLFG